jgi:nucleotide-binding universal stress UspA family protein
MPGKFIVGVDGSPASGRALVWASRLAARADVTIEPVLTWQLPPVAPTILGDALAMPPIEDLEAAAHQQLRDLLTSVSDRLHPDADVSEGVVAFGGAGSVLCDLAEGADLLVVGSRGLGGFKGLVLGSVSAHCANAAPCPVAVIPAEWERDSERGLVVVGVDGSENCAAALAWADEWAAPGATLRLVHTWNYPVGYNAEAIVFDPGVLEEGAQQVLAEAVASVEHHATETVCARGDAREELNVQADEADMLVIGARGHSGIVRLLLGSVASSIVHHLIVPTIVVRAEED